MYFTLRAQIAQPRERLARIMTSTTHTRVFVPALFFYTHKRTMLVDTINNNERKDAPDCDDKLCHQPVVL